MGAALFEVREVRADDRRMSGVHRDPSSCAFLGIAVQIAAIEDQVAGNQLERRLAGPKLDEVDERDTRPRPDLDRDEPVVMRPGRGDDHRATARLELGHDAGVGGVDAGVGWWKTIVGVARANGNPPVTLLPGERERPHECRPGFERDDVTGAGSLERGLEIAARPDGKGATARGHGARLPPEGRELRLSGGQRLARDEDDERRHHDARGRAHRLDSTVTGWGRRPFSAEGSRPDGIAGGTRPKTRQLSLLRKRWTTCPSTRRAATSQPRRSSSV